MMMTKTLRPPTGGKTKTVFWMHKVFLIVVSIASLSHQILQKYLAIQIPFLDNYLDPFCLGVIITFLYQLQINWIFSKRRVSNLEIMVLIVTLSFISEVLFPYLSEQFVADWMDVVAIAIGGFLMYYLQGLRKSADLKIWKIGGL